MSQARRYVDEPATPAPQRPRSPGRPRDPQAERRILDAAIEEYIERGAAGFTMDRVARRAGVGKSTMYLRWSDKDALLVDSVMARSGSIEQVDTGSLRGDLILLSSNLFRFLLDPVGFATFRITVDSVGNDARRLVAADLAERHRASAALVFQRAHERGDHFDPDAAPLVVECLYGAISMRVLAAGFGSRPTDELITAACEQIVDLLLSALLPD